MEQDTKLAVTWFRKAAEQGNASAQSNLGEMYYSGQGGVQDAKQAVVWWRKAAEQGDVEAQHNLGVMYYKGEGIVQDTKLAVTWFRKAAEQGNATTQSILGEMYYSGKGGVQDAKQAVAWWRKAAEQGDAEAQHNLGVMYYKGEGVVQDTKQAVAWISKAAEQGNLNAQRNLEQIQKEAQKSEQEREVDERGDNLYVKTREGDAILTDEPCWLDSSKKNATLPSQNIFPKVGLYGCWEKKSDGYIYIDWFRSLGADGSSLDIHVTDRIPFPG